MKKPSTTAPQFSVSTALVAGAATSLGLSVLVIPLAPSRLLVASIALAWFGAALCGTAFGVARSALVGAPGWIARGVWIVLGAAAGVACAAQLGAVQKLAGPHRLLAIGSLAGGLVVGAALGALLASLQPIGCAPAPLGRLKPVQRAVIASLLAIVALASAAYEASAGWLGSYPAAQRALFGTSLLCAGTGALLLLQSVRSRPLIGTWLVLTALAGLRVILSSDSEIASLSRTAQTEHVTALLRWATDYDRDGSSSYLGGGDCAPWNSNVHPRAREVPGNGVDDNCRRGDAQPPPGLPAASPRAARSAPPLNLVLITVDALRPDHTTPYGYVRDTTPNLAKLAAAGVRYDNAYTSGGWTCLALPSLMTGVYPRRLAFRPWKRPGGDVFTLPRDEQAWTIQRALQERGYRTLFFASHYIHTHVVSFMTRGWDDFALVPGPDDRGVTNTAIARVRALGSLPFFLWVHYYDAHDKQTVHPGAPHYGETLVDGYDHEVASVDNEIGRLLQALEAVDSRGTAILVTADHGEVLLDPYQFHGTDLLEDSIRIPMILHAPSLPPGVVSTPASLVDVAPTLLALSDSPVVRGLDGRDLRGLQGDRIVLTDLWRLDANSNVYLDQIAASSREQRLIYDRLLASTLRVRSRDLRRPPQELPLTDVPPGLRDAIEQHEDQAISP